MSLVAAESNQCGIDKCKYDLQEFCLPAKVWGYQNSSLLMVHPSASPTMPNPMSEVGIFPSGHCKVTCTFSEMAEKTQDPL